VAPRTPTPRPRRTTVAAVLLLTALAALLAPSPRVLAEDDPGATAGLIARARAAAAAKDVAEALRRYFQAIRSAEDYGTKYGLRDEVLALPPIAAQALSQAERATVAARIAEERLRDVEQKAVALEYRDLWLASYLLRRRLHDLEGVSTERAQWIEKDLERIERLVLDEATDAEKEDAKAIEGDPRAPDAAFDRALKAAGEGRGRAALRVLKAIGWSGFATQELKDRAQAAVLEERRRMLDALSAEERAEAEAIWEDPHWKGLATSESHEFVFIGPKAFVETIAAGDRIRMDLACVLLGDLVGRDLTGDGQRLTIYYKERFDFPGGIGGGKRIDIGKQVIAKPIAGELHFHELSHCTFDVGILYPGFVEGIANFGATFTLDAMGRHAEADAAILRNRQSHDADYLQRRVRYFRIQPYAPSCGFLLFPVTAKDKGARQAEWAKFRTFFRRLRRQMPDEPRDEERIRYFAWLWGKTFGWEILGPVEKARFPVLPEDRERVEMELAHWWNLTERGERYAEQGHLGDAHDDLARVLEGCHAGALKDRATFAMALVKEGLGEPEERDRLLAGLGVVPRWKLCLPFYSRWSSPLHAVHAPEEAIDLDATYPNPIQTARWVDAKVTPDGRVDLLQYGIGYPDNAACYALCSLEVPQDVPDAVLRVGFDDLCAAWLDGVLLEKWDAPTSWIRDHHAVAMPLTKGRHRLLLKIVNRAGQWGFSARVARADRTPVPGLVIGDPPAKAYPPSRTEPKGKSVLLLDFAKTKTVPKSHVRPTAGGFEVSGEALRRTVTGNVLWRKFQIQPFSSKDPPDGLFWLEDKDLATLEDFAVEMLVRRPDDGFPRVAVTLHGEGRDDGLSGHTFLLREGGEGVEVRLEEYDRLVYWGTTTRSNAREHVLRFVRSGRTLSCFVDGLPALDRVDLPRLDRAGIGLMTWDKETGFAWVRVDRLGGK
jgi:hypothetical protein